MLVEGGLVVTVLKKPKKCIRQVMSIFLSSSFQYCVYQAGAGDHLSVHYTGRLGGGDGEIFDTSVKKRIPYNFQLGAGQVIQGYERGVPGMCKGETRTLLVPPSMGYGEHGVPGTIPGGATLHFTVELLTISDGVLPPPAREKVQEIT